tara:strand:+ start:384 stop:800 length:417 start_codon:yes stop_codon:yes gene_type:complete
MVSKLEKLSIEQAESKLGFQFSCVSASYYFEHALEKSRENENWHRRLGKRLGVSFAKGYTVSLATKYWVVKPLLELLQGKRDLPELGDTLTMPEHLVIACQLFAAHGDAVRKGFDELSPELIEALQNFDHTQASGGQA